MLFLRMANKFQGVKLTGKDITRIPTAPDVFQAKYAYECLWDCHWETHIGGCYNVALSYPGALARLKEIAEDPNESDNVRLAAQEATNEF